MGFTDNQLLAITSSGSDILVSAAAGSGKTTVLVERIIREIMDEANPVDIDRMLILTFTKAAAASMREKILEAIDKKVKDDPYNEHLAKQAMLVQNAQISTFHGFCQEIIRNHFYEVDADPGLRVIDEAEEKLMQMDALGKVLEAAYERADDEFEQVVLSYTEGKSDSKLESIIFKIYGMAQANPDPEKWLELCDSAYEYSSIEEIVKSSWFESFLNNLREKARDAITIGEQMVGICSEDNGPEKYKPMAEDDLEYAKQLYNAADLSQLSLISKQHEKMKLARITAKDGVDDELKEKFGKKRDALYSITDAIKKGASKSLDEELITMKKISPLARYIISLVREFAEEFAKAKIDGGVIDFNDMEHLAIRILKNNDGITASEYRDRFLQIYVDEYQDSNLTQETIISLISRVDQDGLNGNVFMVGDVKQSIYRFRMARPDLFVGKYKSFERENSRGQGMRIDLSDNFRSREEVLDAANEIFSQIMTVSVGGIEYDDAASLHYGHLYDNVKDTPSDYKSELLLVLKDDELSEAESEAYAIAAKINELVGNFDVKDKETGVIRKLRYSDIVILLRSMSGRDSVYRDVLLSCDIPAYVTTGVGYFAAKEIETLLNLLAIIDNPLHDIAFVSILESYFGGFSDEEIAIIRSKCKKGYFYNTFTSYLDESDRDALSEKICAFLDFLNQFRSKSEYMSVYEILREIIDGGYGDYIKSLPNGKQGSANLNMLLKKAEDFGKLSYKGLFHFLRYIEQMRKYEVDYGEAGIIDENDQSVRIMTIHKSKGLEFPLVFVSALSKGRNTNDEKNEIITDADLGIGLNCVDTKLRLKRSTLLRDYMIERLKRENLAEEIRVLYVALTRAQEKLVMVGCVKDFDKDFYNKEMPLTMCNSYLDMLAYVYSQKGCFKNIGISHVTAEDMIISEIERNLSAEDAYMKLIHILEEKDKSETLLDTSLLDFEYPYANDFPQFAKVSVSELKKRSIEENSAENEDAAGEAAHVSNPFAHNESSLPSFMRESGEPENVGTFYGTAFHRMLELWDYSISYGREDELTEEEVASFFAKMCDGGRIEPDQLKTVRASEILLFLKSDVAKRMGEANSKGELRREQPFVFAKGAEMMLIQGIIDAYWIENGEIVLLDYKTDRVESGDELINRYKVQLELYAEALNQLIELPVKETVIYSARLRNTYSL